MGKSGRWSKNRMTIITLKKLRIKHNLSNIQMAHILGLQADRYTCCEAGSKRLPVCVYEKVKRIFGVSLTLRRADDIYRSTNKRCLGGVIKKIRIEKGITIKWMAYKLGISRSLLDHIEKGTRIPSRKFSEKFCKVLRIPIEKVRSLILWKKL